MIEAEIHLAKRPKLFRQTEPPLLQSALRLSAIGKWTTRNDRSTDMPMYQTNTHPVTE